MRALLALLALTAATSDASADDSSFRCGNKLVVAGDTRAQVQDKCGDPDDVQTRSILRAPVYWINGRPYHVGDGMVELPVESWTYNLGPNKFMRLVTFVDGRVEEIKTLGYGY